MSSVEDYFSGSTQSAQTSAVAAIDDDPEQAARSVELSNASGVPATAIYGDVDGFERSHKAALSSQIIAGNSYIADYLNSHPMAPRISNDDLGQLDNASRAIGNIPEKSTLQKLHEALGVAKLGEVAFPGDPLGPYKELGLSRPTDLEFAAKHPAMASLLAAGQDLVGFPMVFGSQILSGATNLVNHIAGREAASLLEYGMMRGDIKAPGTGGQPDIEHIAGAMRSAAPWLRAGQDVPVGVHPILDDLAKQQATTDGKAMKDALSESVKSATRDRAPDYYATFARGHVGDREIGIAADAVRELYGDELPTADDGKLGFVPDLADQLVNAEATGGDIHVPLADWLAKVDPEIADTLHDHLRVRPNGITIEEGKNLEPIESVTEPLPLVRGTAALEPMFSVGDRKLTLDKRPMQESSLNDPAIPADMFDLLDENGNKRGWMRVVPFENGKKLYVDNIGGKKGANMFGPALTRDIARQLKAEYPDAEQVGGFRISGAREKAGTEREVWMKFEDLNDPLKWKGFHEGWTDIQQGVAGEPIEMTPEKQKIVDSVNEVLNRIAPKGVGVEGFERIQTDAGNRVGGVYTRYEDAAPWISWSLESKNPVATARHEAIHFLRDSGRISPDEWSILSRAARDGDWVKAHRIDSRFDADRLSNSAKIEESIADQFKKWEQSPEADSPIGKIFQKIKDILDQIRASLRTAFGKENWEDVFRKIESGEVGEREGKAGGQSDALHFEEEAKPELRPAIKEEDDTIRVGEPGQMHMEIKAKNPKESGWIDHEGNFLNQEQATAYSEKHFSRGGDYLEELAESGRPATLAEMEEMEKNASPADIAYDFYVTVGRNNHKEALKLFDEDVSSKLIKSDPRFAKARDIILSNLDASPKFEDLEEDRAPFEKANALGMTVDQYRRYQKLMERRNAEDLEAAHKSALEYQRKTQTKEWKVNRTEMRDQVREELESRPDLALDQLMSQEKLKFHPDAISDAQREILPKEYLQKKDGINPDDAAGYFGYHSGDAMVERLGLITRDRQAAGMKAREWLNHLIDTETDRRMQEQFGNLDQNILEDAKEQAISATQLDILHEEVLHLGLKAGSEFPISKEQLKQWNKEIFDKTPVGSISTDAYLRTAGKAGRAAEMALLKEDFAEAFREKQRQNNAMIMASYAKAYEKSRRAFDRTAKSLGKKEVPSVAPEWLNWIQDILQRTGNKVNHLPSYIQENIFRQSEKTLHDFTQAKEAENFGKLKVVESTADYLLDPNFHSKMGDLTAAQFADLKGTIDAYAKMGRDEKKVFAQGEAADVGEVLKEAKAKLGTFPKRALPDERGYLDNKMAGPRKYIAGSTAIPTLLHRWDRADPRGILNRYLNYPLREGDNTKARLERETAAAVNAVGPLRDPEKLVDAPFPDPLSRSEDNPHGTPWVGFANKHVLGMLAHAGNKSNWRVLARGYSTDPEALMAWLGRNVTKEDVLQAQKRGDTVFKPLIDKADIVKEHTTGRTIEKIPLESVTFHHADGTSTTVPGYYHPLDADPLRKEVWVKQENGTWQRNATGRQDTTANKYGNNYATTANGYTKGRTGAVYPLNLDITAMNGTLKEMIHDISYSEPLLQAKKILGNRSFQAEVIKHYGEEYAGLLPRYLEDIAGNASNPGEILSSAAQFSNALRRNTVTTYIGYNLLTAAKHGPTALVWSGREIGWGHFLPEFSKHLMERLAGDPLRKGLELVGAKYYADAVKSLYGRSPELGKTMTEYAMENSEVLQRRLRHWNDSIAGVTQDLTGKSTIAERFAHHASVFVAESDMLSARSTWVGENNKRLAQGLSLGEARELADNAVSRAHGDIGLSNQPELVRRAGGDIVHPWLITVYGFMGNRLQRMIETAHQGNDIYQLGKAGEINAAMKKAPKFLADIMMYAIWPIMVEEAVASVGTDDHRSLGMKALSGLTAGMSSELLYIRDLVHGLVEGNDPGVGLISTMLHDIKKGAGDIAMGKKAFTKEHIGRTIEDLTTMMGEFKGVGSKPIGRALHFATDVITGQQKPKTAADRVRGTLKGTMKLREVK